VQHVLVDNEKVSPDKIHLVHHGFDLVAFEHIEEDRIKAIHQNYNPNKKRPVIGVIARWIEWKGIQYIIPAFKKLLIDYPGALLVLANANGPYKKEIEELLNGLPENSYQIIQFENDLFALYQLFDVYVHTPINYHIEAFGQTYVEALASGIPSIFTPSGVASEFIEHEKNALVIPFKDSDATYHSITRILVENSFREELIQNGIASANMFSLNIMIDKLKKLYVSQEKK